MIPSIINLKTDYVENCGHEKFFIIKALVF